LELNTKALFERLNISISYIDNQKSESTVLSFSYRASRGEYGIYIRKNIDAETYSACDRREKGRILFNHFIRCQACKNLFDEAFRRNMPLIFFRLPEDKNINQRIGLYSTYIYRRFSGIAQAMEVNSKVFKTDWLSTRPLFEKYMRNSVRKQEYLSYPKDAWPGGLDWITYMLFLCRDMRWTLDEISGGNNKIKTGDISAYNNELRDEKQIQEAHETRKTIIPCCGSEVDERIRRGRTTSVTGQAALHSISECNSLEQFLAILRERSVTDKRRRLFTDMLYNINRNKFDSNIFIPRRLYVSDKTPVPVCILLDVSGSVPTALLKRIVRAIADVEYFLDKKKSRLVCWSDGLCSDTPLEGINNFTAGGGTILAPGIKYCKKYLCDNASFFIVSDFQDDLGDWIRAARNISARKTAVACTAADARLNFAEWFSRAGSNANSHTTEVTPAEFTAVFDTVLLHAG
jgi:hypothetical protein